MIKGELKSFGSADCYNRSLSLIPADPTNHITMGSQDWDGDTTLSASAFSGAQMNTMYNVIANPQSVALADHNLPMPDSLISNFTLETCDNSVESSQLPFGWPQDSSGNNMFSSFVPLNHWIPKEEPVSSETCMNMDWKEAELQQSVHTVNLNDANEFQSNLKGEEDTSYSAPKPLRSMCKKTKNRSEADSRRRSIIAQKVKALKELLPGTLKGSRGNQESIVHDFTSYIKYLQLQLKIVGRKRKFFTVILCTTSVPCLNHSIRKPVFVVLVAVGGQK
ncbi:uncharacterized protein LOC130827698 isoform X3 [Amaranthus tricolor]|uniref:uncharacterized protein LOC130827698 isoform X3 n=1 Tax=Amaranthus tricolor TaxID=29722 RepID=UPI00258C2155|nr:uncharacterized protein LOC130827698 isoform X3 [Amaranthus tricolor]